MAKLMYWAITSLDGYVADTDGNFGSPTPRTSPESRCRAWGTG